MNWFYGILVLIISQYCDMCIYAQKHDFVNGLVNEKSDYLLQHANNPVFWLPWSNEAFEKAAKDNKIVIISVGYSSCHWCHEMERQVFEDERIAAFMNEHFICIKVDREERPDIDKKYMLVANYLDEAAGWPLNCFTLDDGRPFHAVTYLPPNEWMNLLNQIVETNTTKPNTFREIAENMDSGLEFRNFIPSDSSSIEFTMNEIDQSIAVFKNDLDTVFGGVLTDGNKFPMSPNLSLLSDLCVLNNDETLEGYVSNTLDKMLNGGIYDQIGGGFFRYSVDNEWKIPHFEKLLITNAQLISNLAIAYKLNRSPKLKIAIDQSIDWLTREMMDDDFRFYASQDAESEAVEGFFYTWSKDELKSILKEDYSWMKDFFNVSPLTVFGFERYVLIRSETNEEFAEKLGISLTEFEEKLNANIALLYRSRVEREHPKTDKKLITSWNAMMVIGLLDAYEAIGDPRYFELAQNCMKEIMKNVDPNDQKQQLNHIINRESQAFLDDYAYIIRALIQLYRVSFDEEFLKNSELLMRHALTRFSDDKSPYFLYSIEDGDFSLETMEFDDLTKPSSNAVMAENLFLLGTYFENENYIKRSKEMCLKMKRTFQDNGLSFSYWGKVMNYFASPVYEVAIVGRDVSNLHKNWLSQHIPNAILFGGMASLPALESKKEQTESAIYVCKEKVCQLPVKTVNEALQRMPR